MIEDKEENISKEVTRTKDLEKQQYILMHKVWLIARHAAVLVWYGSCRRLSCILLLVVG